LIARTTAAGVLQGAGQLLINALVKAPSAGRAQRVASAVLRIVRALILRAGDPVVSYELAGRRLLLPLSHELPFVRKTYPSYARNAGYIADAVVGKYPQLRAIDIGANVGDTAATWHQHASFPILCLEGVREFFVLLGKNTAHDKSVTVVEAFVAGRSGSVTATVSVGHGTARLKLSGGTSSTVNVRRLSELIESHPDFRNSKLLKLDTDGMDADILMSESRLLVRARPVILFEYAPALTIPSEARRVFPMLSRVGYKSALVFENSGEYLLSASLRDNRLLDDIHAFCRNGRYVDICAFHEEDLDIFGYLRAEHLGKGMKELERAASMMA
jgi:FkbM family methyltransferase